MSLQVLAQRLPFPCAQSDGLRSTRRAAPKAQRFPSSRRIGSICAMPGLPVLCWLASGAPRISDRSWRRGCHSRKPLSLLARPCAQSDSLRSTRRAAPNRSERLRGFHTLEEFAPYIILEGSLRTPARPRRALGFPRALAEARGGVYRGREGFYTDGPFAPFGSRNFSYRKTLISN